MGSQRGLVISPPVEIISSSTIRNLGGALDPQLVRSSLLFWDVLDWPMQGMISIDLDVAAQADVDFMISCGVLERTYVEGPYTGNAGDIFADIHLSVLNHLDSLEPGKWSLASCERSLNFPKLSINARSGIIVKLHNAIPVPDKDVPLEQIIEFKERRHDELVCLRHHLEAVYQKIISAGDGALAMRTEFEQLEDALKDYAKASIEGRFSLRLADLGANLNAYGAIGAAVSAHALGAPVFESVIVGLTSHLSIDIGAALKGRSKTGSPYQYVTSYHRELFYSPQ